MNTIESESRVLAGIVPSNTVRMEAAQLRAITENNFSTPDLKILWKFIDAYYDDHMEIMPSWVLKKTLINSGQYPDSKVVSLVDMYEVFANANVPEHEFKSAMSFLKEDESSRRTDEAIVTAREILKGEYFDAKGEASLRGQEDARTYLSEVLQELEVDNIDYAPEGNIRDDMDKILRAYLEKEANPEKSGGIKYGITEVDMVTGGISPGDLVLVAGFTGDGKSQIVTSLAWNAIREGKNVIMFTTETTREEMEIRILARHSRLPKFKCPGGLDSHNISHGTLSPEHKEVFINVLKDFKEMDTGELFMVQMPTSGNVDYVYAKTAQYNRRAPIDMVVVDSINLLRKGRRFDSKLALFDEMLPDFKRFASSFDNGRGVAVVSPWQMSRSAWNAAKEAGGVYTLASLADTSEAEKCFTRYTSVITPSGPVPICALREDSDVFDMFGEVQQVLEVHDQEEMEIYEVVLNDGTVMETTIGHTWRTDDNGRPKLMTTKDIMESEENIYLPSAPDLFSYYRSPVSNERIFDPRAFSEIVKYGETDHVGLWISPRDYSQFMRAMPEPSRAIIVDGVTKYYFLWDNVRDYLGERTFEDLETSKITQPNKDLYEVPYSYITATDRIRMDFLCSMFEGYYPPPSARQIGPSWTRKMPKDPAMLKNLYLDHPGLGPGMRSITSSFGWFLDKGPRYVVEVRQTGRTEPTRCLTVTGPSSTYLVESHVVTHNSSSQIITIFKEEEVGGTSRLNIQVLKNRGGEEMAKVAYPFDWRNSYIGSSSEVSDTPRSKETRDSFNTSIMGLL